MKFLIDSPEVKVKQIDAYNSIVETQPNFELEADSFREVLDILDEKYDSKIVDCSIYTNELENNFRLKWNSTFWRGHLWQRANEADKFLKSRAAYSSTIPDRCF